MPRTPRRAYQTLVSRSDTVPDLVEHCFPLSTREAVGDSPRHARSTRRILISRTSAREYRYQISILIEADLVDAANAFLHLEYEIEGIAVRQLIQLTSSAAPFRWWFVCPFLGIRVAKLYLPPAARHFGSRKFYGLVYKCQASRKGLRHLSPDVDLLRRSTRKSLAKASTKPKRD
jgi:hypothetical protein